MGKANVPKLMLLMSKSQEVQTSLSPFSSPQNLLALQIKVQKVILWANPAIPVILVHQHGAMEFSVPQNLLVLVIRALKMLQRARPGILVQRLQAMVIKSWLLSCLKECDKRMSTFLFTKVN